MDAPEALAEQGETSYSGLSGGRLLDRPPPLLPRRLLPAFLSAVTHGPFPPFPTLTNLCCVQVGFALRTTPVRRALGVPAPPPVQPIYIRCLPSSPSVSPPTHRFVVSSGPLNSTSSKCKKAFPLRVTQVSSGSPVARAQAPQNPAGDLPLASSGAPAAPDCERLDGGGGGATLEQYVFRRVTRRLAPAPSRDAAAWIGTWNGIGSLLGWIVGANAALPVGSAPSRALERQKGSGPRSLQKVAGTGGVGPDSVYKHTVFLMDI
ncbi:hypothetical protein MJT46_012653 [Ovis ammon polii x Ovis aries]|nr:hypothetical protein MJT46_012653 [Ovis ammon polii x Ovis aries]